MLPLVCGLSCGFDCGLVEGPRQEVVEVGVGMACGNRLEGNAQVGERLDTVYLTSGDEPGDPSSVLGTLVVAGKEGVLLPPGQRPDLVLDEVAVHLNPSVLSEEDQPFPAGQDVGDGLIHLGVASSKVVEIPAVLTV